MIICIALPALAQGEVVVGAGDKEAITCTDIGDLLSSCCQCCVTQ